MSASTLVLPPAAVHTYHRIISPTLRIPEEKSVPVPVGLLACQRDPLLTELKTYIIYCRATQGLQAAKDKKKKEAPQPQGPIYEVLLHDTVIFPEGGGQPSDIGYLKDEKGTQWDVLEVKRQGGHAIHYVKGDDSILKALIPGGGVTVGLGDAGFERRYDHMCMHTSQHLISALLETKLNLPTPSWYLAPSPNPSYIEVPRAPTAEELKEIERLTNEYCSKGTRVHVEVEELNENMRDNSDDRNVSKGLPSDYTGGVNRTIVIENVDRNPCCGTHLPTLQGLSVFILPETESLSRGRARIYFCAGPRIRAYLAQIQTYLSAATSSYGCAPNQVAERIMFEADGRKKATKRAEELESEVAEFIAKDIRAAMEKQAEQPRFSYFYHRQDSSSNPLTLLNAIETSWRASPLPSKHYLIVLVSTGMQASSNKAVVLVFGSNEMEVKQLGDKFKAKGIKGGGKGKWSGKTDDWKATGGDKWVKDLLQE
ncbi:hypothetical protein M422DRAFT_198087 [Sphaerobolus stellatus SS14]|nr:hypothetical protein M422DRAFT_198087 [Sphaerobolus stellatus SS14]